jgi:hypothetical protein
MQIHTLNITQSSKLWCGIAALAAATGKDTEACRKILRAVLDDNEILTGRVRVLKGIYASEFTKALAVNGIDHTRIWNHKEQGQEISFARYLLVRRPKQGKVCIGIVPGHIFAFDHQIVVDNQHPNGITFFNYKYVEQPIQHIFELQEFAASDLF